MGLGVIVFRSAATIWLLAAILGAFLAWAALFELDQVVRSQGKVVPSGQNKLVQHLEGGIIADIFINEGDLVKINQPLFRLENISAKARLLDVEIDRLSLLYRKTRLEQQIQGKKTIRFPTDSHAEAAQIKQNELELYRSEIADFLNQQNVLITSIKFKKATLTEQEILLDNLKNELRLAQEDLVLLRRLEKSGAVSRRELLVSEGKIQAIKTRLDSTNASIPSAKAEIKTAQARLKQNKSNYTLSLQNELNDISLRLSKAVEQQRANKDREQRTIINSPVDGIINRLLVNTKGGIIQPGDTLAEITPLNEMLIVEAQIAVRDRGDIWLNQAVKIKISAYDFTKYGVLEGYITQISPDSSSDNQGNFFYTARINVSQNFGEDKPIIPGMVAQIDIITGKKTILEYLLNPIRRSLSTALREN